jgi:hypothetical protein
MASPIKIFICYKKILSRTQGRKIFERQNQAALVLHFYLSQLSDRYDPWIDQSKLEAGVEWELEIYRRIIECDVLLLLVAPGTFQSQWVQREIALATALGISIVPLGADITDGEMTSELKALGIDHLQGKTTKNIKLDPRPANRDALISEIESDIESAAERTKKQQDVTLRGLLDRRQHIEPNAPNNQRASSFMLKLRRRKINLHVASGDISSVRNIDVLVNSENDYMQMARFFESRTVSSILRRLGARVREGKYEDTIQTELEWQLRGQGRPLQPAAVFATSAGGPSSELATTNRARYIVHVAAVQAVLAHNNVTPFTLPHQIEACVRACLDKIASIDQDKGIISPPNSEQFENQKKLADAGRHTIHSVIFPLFGTGQGGSNTKDVLSPMFAGIKGYFDDFEDSQKATELTDIYISAFKRRDVDEVTTFLRNRFG